MTKMTMNYYNYWYTQDHGDWDTKVMYFNKRENAYKWIDKNGERYVYKYTWGDKEYIKHPKFKVEEIITED